MTRSALPSFLTAGAGQRLALGLCLATALASPLPAQRATRPNLTEMSMEELMNLEVTTVSKHAEKLGRAPAAVFVLTADDLRRAGVNTLPAALRLVPGMQVGRVDAHNWAISARGFADVFANKLLVLRDGRSLYTPLYSGVFWDAQDTLLQDIERIEVVRGPGATLWGANAVNGVINILAKPARDTQGLLVSALAGLETDTSAAVRYGGALDRDTHYRVFGKYTRYAASELAAGGRARDAWRLGTGGFRVDTKSGGGNLLTVQGDAYTGRKNQVFILPLTTFPFVIAVPDNIHLDGGNLLARWTGRGVAGGELVAQTYYDYTKRETAIIGETRRTFDLELQQRFAPGGPHEIIAGAGYRTTADQVRNTAYVALAPPQRRTHLWNAFVQDDVTLAPHRWRLILGSKIEHNDFTGWEVQPGARLLWTPDERHTFWASVARAVRTPSRAEADITLFQLTSRPGVTAETHGSRAFASEVLAAYEAGYRFRAREKATIDLTLFYNDYSHLRTTDVTPASLPQLARLLSPTPPTTPVQLITVARNGLRGETYGGELTLAAQPAPAWRVRAAGSLLRMQLHRLPGSTDLFAENDERRSPRLQAYFWSQHDLAAGWQVDWRLWYVSRLFATAVPSYLELDARLAWRPAAQWEVSLVGQNLLDPHHPEFVPATITTPATEAARSVFIAFRYDY